MSTTINQNTPSTVSSTPSVIPIADVVPYTPNGTVHLLSNIPWNNSYDHVIDFADVLAQYTWMAAKKTRTFTGFTPVRLQNRIRVPVNAQEVYNCNYLMWQNTNFGNKWFYGFISGIYYVNTTMTEIEFELDIYQTWMFEAILNPCFVEREMIGNDYVGANVMPENLELGEYVNGESAMSDLSLNPMIAIATAVNELGNVDDGMVIGEIYQGIHIRAYGMDQIDQVNNFIKTLTGMNKQDAIVAIYMFPRDFMQSTTDSGVKIKSWQVPIVHPTFGTYTPKNNKLYTYPYNFMYMTNMAGNSATFKYEYFDGAPAQFFIAGGMQPGMNYLLYPAGYKQTGDNFNEVMTLGDFPQCSFVSDTYKAWLAQNKSSLSVANMGSGLAMAAGLVGATTNPVGAGIAVTGALIGVQSTMARVNQAEAQPAHTHGNQQSDALFSMKKKDFLAINMHITEEYAKSIDGYFSMFGYQTNQVKTPNTRNRPSWNYVKTQNCCLTGNVPLNHLARLNEIYNKGLTIWHGDYIGQYDRNNK